ncbi:fungal-specific transcription factor domain-containing protein [Fusarium flagelliforme]|uniref:Transcription factor n=1 Tax=Fusarium flagelliforme TaxID=2675880 RepID=A0A395MCR8_9HYPO|nr:fungal-specific transcription factor domain-containing protein [Fusarium flagelliforme]KAH7174395.1 fungal-specific transcription factor domain-containing protein [Fusarium flagelliforme]RFN45610.1 transcription factor [Fusarium flagelliforme]
MNSIAQAFQDSPNDSDTSVQKRQRVLACTHCQQRKIKCNRVFPCSNCAKANLTCVPSKPTPIRKRRTPNVLLQERIKKVEALLEQYTLQGSPGQSSSAAQDGTDFSPSASPAPSNGTPNQATPGSGRLVVKNGGYKFLDSCVWGTIHDNLEEMRNILDQETSDEETCPSRASPVPLEDVDLLLAKTASSNIGDNLPLPFQILRLWQVFLNRVNPLTKMIHGPSTESLIISAMTDPMDMPHKSRALLFSICLISVVSLSKDEAKSMLDLQKNEAIQKFTNGLKVALNKVNYLRNYDMATLQALVFYLLSLQGRSNHDAVWVLSGAVIRIAHKMGLHRDGEILGLSPYETEIRRRVWWQIVTLDSMYATTSGIKPTSLLSAADTKMPQNVNDTDFSTESAMIQPREGGTEMSFLMIIFELIKFISDHQASDFEHLLLGGVGAEPGTPEYQTYQEALQELRGLVDEFDLTLAEAEKKYCDQSGGPLNALTLFLRPHIIKEGRIMATSMEEAPEWGTEVRTPKDNFFRIWLAHNEGVLEVYKMSNQGSYLWAFKAHFHLDALLFLASQLAERSPLGSFAERTWRVFDGFYHYHEELWNLTQKTHVQLARLLLKAWELRETTTEAPVDIPVFIPKLKMALLQAGLCWPNQSATIPQSLDEGSLMNDMQSGEVPVDMPTMPLDWSMADDQQLMDAQNPALPIFAFFNGANGW